MIFTRARNLEDGVCTEALLCLEYGMFGTEYYSILTTGSIWLYSNLPSCLASASTVRNQGIRALVRRAVMRDFESYSGVSHEPAQSLNLRIDSGNHINTCSSIIVLTFLPLPIICELQGYSPKAPI